jgi:hypothetical protein
MIELTDEQILDLIFERQIEIDNLKVRGKHTFLGLLSKLDERMRNGKVDSGEVAIFCRPLARNDHGARGTVTLRTCNRRGKKGYVEV